MKEPAGSQNDISLLEAINELPAVSVTFQKEENGKLKVINYSDGFCRMMKCSRKEAENYYAAGTAFQKSFIARNHELLEQYAAHKNDPCSVSYTCQIPTVRGDYMWVMVQFHSFETGGHLYVYMVFSDIDGLKLHVPEPEEQYRSAQAFMNAMADTYMVVRRCNLTKNMVEEISGIEALPDVGAVREYDRSLEMLLHYIPEEQDRKECAEYYSRAHLTSVSDAGRMTVSKDYQLTSADGSVKWVRSIIHLMRRSEDGNLITFHTLQDVNSEITEKKLTEHTIGMDYQAAVYYDLHSEKLYVRTGGDGAFVRMDYQTALSRLLERVDASCAGEIAQKFRQDRILTSLDNCPVYTVYTFYFTEKARRDDLPGSPQRQMKNDIFFLDERRSVLVLLISDVTEIFPFPYNP